jgi:hypothetical protein
MSDDFSSETQVENAKRQREWEARARPEGEPLPLTAIIEHPITRETRTQPEGSELTIVRLGRVAYREGPDAPRPPANPPPEDAP